MLDWYLGQCIMVLKIDIDKDIKEYSCGYQTIPLVKHSHLIGYIYIGAN